MNLSQFQTSPIVYLPSLHNKKLKPFLLLYFCSFQDFGDFHSYRVELLTLFSPPLFCCSGPFHYFPTLFFGLGRPRRERERRTKKARNEKMGSWKINEDKKGWNKGFYTYVRTCSCFRNTVKFFPACYIA